MHFIYIDDSGEGNTALFTAIAVSTDNWNDVFNRIKDFRKKLKIDYGIPIKYELHAWKFSSGRGNPSSKIITKYERSTIFKETVEFISQISDFSIFNVIGKKNEKLRLLEWLLNRIDRTLIEWKSLGMIILDEGDEYGVRRLQRRMRVWNPIPSQHGTWKATNTPFRNIPIHHIIEDPVLRKSDQSYFIQLCDFCAYALLRKELPLQSKSKYGYDQLFEILKPRLVLAASPKDPDGIIRV